MPAPLDYRWTWQLASRPEKLWPYLADTDRFNRDIGLPALRFDPSEPRQRNGRRKLAIRLLGFGTTWLEEPFEWVWPKRFSVLRHFDSGPVREARIQLDLEKAADGGTHLTMTLRAIPRGRLGRLAFAAQMLLRMRHAVDRAYRAYDHLAQAEEDFATAQDSGKPQPHDPLRLVQACDELSAAQVPPRIVQALRELIARADASRLAHLRPYALADQWRLPRRQVLEACLFAVRARLLEYQWELLCPLCRGGAAFSSLKDLPSHTHCPSCNIDFNANFECATELIFRPAPAIRPIDQRPFCVGSPGRTPHIVAQKFLKPGETHDLEPTLEPGRYRLRALELRGGQYLRVSDDPAASGAVTLAPAKEAWSEDEPLISPSPRLRLENPTTDEQLFILERLAWTDQAATAADVILLQKFRDLFSAEILRPGQQFSVGPVAILFTDLRASTELYRRIGDAPAFGRVMSHFDILRDSIAQHGGALIKTIGDAVMAAFKEPQQALAAAQLAQRRLSELPEALILKAGIHYGPAIAVTLNERLDYFGATVNLAARLVALSSGEDVVVSDAVYRDPQLGPANATSFHATLKGHHENVMLWRIR